MAPIFLWSNIFVKMEIARVLIFRDENFVITRGGERMPAADRSKFLCEKFERLDVQSRNS